MEEVNIEKVDSNFIINQANNEEDIYEQLHQKDLTTSALNLSNNLENNNKNENLQKNQMYQNFDDSSIKERAHDVLMKDYLTKIKLLYNDNEIKIQQLEILQNKIELYENQQKQDKQQIQQLQTFIKQFSSKTITQLNSAYQNLEQYEVEKIQLNQKINQTEEKLEVLGNSLQSHQLEKIEKENQAMIYKQQMEIFEKDHKKLQNKLKKQNQIQAKKDQDYQSIEELLKMQKQENCKLKTELERYQHLAEIKEVKVNKQQQTIAEIQKHNEELNVKFKKKEFEIEQLQKQVVESTKKLEKIQKDSKRAIQKKETEVVELIEKLNSVEIQQEQLLQSSRNTLLTEQNDRICELKEKCNNQLELISNDLNCLIYSIESQQWQDQQNITVLTENEQEQQKIEKLIFQNNENNIKNIQLKSNFQQQIEKISKMFFECQQHNKKLEKQLAEQDKQNQNQQCMFEQLYSDFSLLKQQQLHNISQIQTEFTDDITQLKISNEIREDQLKNEVVKYQKNTENLNFELQQQIENNEKLRIKMNQQQLMLSEMQDTLEEQPSLKHIIKISSYIVSILIEIVLIQMKNKQSSKSIIQKLLSKIEEKQTAYMMKFRKIVNVILFVNKLQNLLIIAKPFQQKQSFQLFKNNDNIDNKQLFINNNNNANLEMMMNFGSQNQQNFCNMQEWRNKQICKMMAILKKQILEKSENLMEFIEKIEKELFQINAYSNEWLVIRQCFNFSEQITFFQ